MMKTFSVVSVLAIAAGVNAAAFNVIGFEAGGGVAGIAGPGFTTSSGGFYNPTGAGTNGNTSVGAPFAASNPWSDAQSYDSYFTLSGSGPARLTPGDGGTDTLTPQLLSYYPYSDSLDAPSTIAGPGSHIGATNDNDGQAPFAAGTPVMLARAGIATDPNVGGAPNTPSGINPKSGQDGVLIAQFTLNRGATLTGGIFLSISVAPGVQFDGTLTLGGGPVLFQTANGPQLLELNAYKVATNENLVHSRSGGNAGTGAGNAQRFGAADVYHVWIETVPAPTAVAAFGLAGLAGLRRRRA